jgi:beta-N-acetylglucosaminidase
MTKKEKCILCIVTGLIVVFLTAFGVSMYSTTQMINGINQQIRDNHSDMKEMKEKLDEIQKANESRENTMREEINNIKKQVIMEGTFKKEDIKNIKFDETTDLKAKPTLAISDMNQLIEVWEDKIGITGFHGRGNEFIRAGIETGLNPVYLLAHAAVESAWGQSHYAVYRGNYFGIGAVDSNPDNAHYMSGIVEGAKWIDENFYQDGAISLSDMKANNYASSPYWEGQIAQIVRTSYSILAQLQELEEQENQSQNM